MNQNSIIISPVANGFIVQLPFKVKMFDPNHNEQDFVSSLVKAANIMQGDSTLNDIRNKNEQKESFQKDENCFIFDSMEKVLSFLADKYI